MDDSQIVELYLDRNESAIAETAEKYGNKLKKIAKNVLSDLETVDECENDAYLKTWNLIPPNEPRTYLFVFVGRIIRHLAIDRLRHESRQKRSALFCELTDEMLDQVMLNMKMKQKNLQRLLTNFWTHVQKSNATFS